MNSLMSIITMVKLLFFLRIHERYVLLVQLLFQVSKDIGPFLVIFFVLIIQISFLYRIAGVEVPKSEYDDLNTYFMYIIQIFRNAIGDVQVPVTAFWKPQDNLNFYHTSIMIGYGWLLWIFCIIMNLVVMLNFLISIISSSYETVMQKAN